MCVFACVCAMSWFLFGVYVRLRFSIVCSLMLTRGCGGGAKHQPVEVAIKSQLDFKSQKKWLEF